MEIFIEIELCVGGECMIKLDYKSNKPIYEQIIEQVKLNAIKGYLREGDIIPSVRKLAIELSITPTTVAKAYQELERQKVIETVRGKGTFIAQSLNVKQNTAVRDKAIANIRSSVLELKMMEISKEDIIEIVDNIYEELE